MSGQNQGKAGSATPSGDSSRKKQKKRKGRGRGGRGGGDEDGGGADDVKKGWNEAPVNDEAGKAASISGEFTLTPSELQCRDFCHLPSFLSFFFLFICSYFPILCILFA